VDNGNVRDGEALGMARRTSPGALTLMAICLRKCPRLRRGRKAAEGGLPGAQHGEKSLS
jgi:hypothetical protein